MIVIQPYLVTFNARSFKVEWNFIVSIKKKVFEKGECLFKAWLP
jgi:hypothetical protein